LLSEARIIFDRLTVNIDAINAKILAVFQIFLILVTLEISLFGLVFNLSNLSCLDWVLFSWVVVVSVVTLGYLWYLILPKRYEYPKSLRRSAFRNSVVQIDLRSSLIFFITHERLITPISRPIRY
jgi:hypothetical protein